MAKLELYEEYTREEVNNIFNPDVAFTPGAGIYGIHGLIRVPQDNKNPDFIFFVTIGQKKLGYEFTEEISVDGKLNWQSQPSQTLDNERIQQLINHNHKSNNIYLFIRHGKVAKEYIYLGNLAYITHDTSKEKPVHFVWKIINWSRDTIDKLKEIGIEVTKVDQQNKIDNNDESLIKVDPPQTKSIVNERKQNSDYHDGIVYKPDYFAIQKKKVKIGELGEQLVYENETQHLRKCGFPELAEKVRKMSDYNDKLGYDIISYNKDGSKKLIEVKTTTGGKGLGFHISANEVKVSNENPDDYYIYRVFDYNELTGRAKYYIIQGSVLEHFDLIPTEYKATYNCLNYK